MGGKLRIARVAALIRAVSVFAMPSTTPIRWPWLAVLAFVTVLPSTHSARILGVFPYRGWSHFASFQPLLLELARKGHDVTVLCPFDPPKDAPETYKVIPLKGVTSISSEGSIDADTIYSLSFSFTGVKMLEMLSEDLCTNGLRHQAVKDLVNSKREFDLIFVEVFNTDCFLGFTHRFKAPVIGMSSHSIMPWAFERMGCTPSLSFASNIFTGKGDNLGLFGRARNFVEYWTSMAYYKWYEWGRQKLVKEAFGEDVPTTFELARNFSMLFVNSHETVHSAKPLSPNIINVAGMHLPKPQPLDQDLRTFIDGSKEGLIYFNMGSLLRGESFPKNKVDALLHAFSQLKHRVIWKWEGAPPQNAPKNVKFLAWVKQFDVLQHPKTKLFISHGGMLGTAEAVHSGVPIVVIPMFGDQPFNAAELVARGVARRLPYHDLIDSGKILEALRDVLENPKYAEKARQKSEEFRDRPLAPLDLAVYWSEFVIRHKGAAHLRPAAADMPYYQLFMLDVFALLLTPIVFLWWAVRRCCCRKGSSDKRKSKRD